MAHDPVRLELVKNAIGSVVDEMVLTVIRIAYSSIMKDTMDLSSAFCDRQGRMIAQGLSLRAASRLDPRRDGRRARASTATRSQPGDIVVLNDPYQGGMHLPDIFMFKPVFVERASAGLRRGGRASQRHGRTRARLERRRLDRDLPGRAAHPGAQALRARRAEPDAVRHDRAQRAHSRRRAGRPAGAGRRLPHRRARHGASSRRATASTPSSSYFDELLDYSEREARRTMRSIPRRRTASSTTSTTTASTWTSRCSIAVPIHVQGDELTVDLEGTSPQVRGAINSTLSFAKSAVYFAVRSIMDSDAPNNSGFFRPIHVKAPLGCLVNPTAAGGRRGARHQRLPADRRDVRRAGAGDSASACAPPARAAPRATASAATTRDGRFSLFREAMMGAWGGGYRRDGIDGVANGAANISNAPIEMVENQAPIRVEHYELVPDSGGPGEWRGGMSVVAATALPGRARDAAAALRPPAPSALRPHGRPRRDAVEQPAGGSTASWRSCRPSSRGRWPRARRSGTRRRARGGYGDPLRRDPDARARTTCATAR